MLSEFQAQYPGVNLDMLKEDREIFNLLVKTIAETFEVKPKAAQRLLEDILDDG